LSPVLFLSSAIGDGSSPGFQTMRSTKIKICGITNIRDAIFAVANGADALGFNMFKASPRYVTLETATEIVRQLPPFVTSVALLVNHSEKEVKEVIASGVFNLLQFHGDETNDFCGAFRKPFTKVLRVKNVTDLPAELVKFRDSKGILLDTFVEGVYGGTGTSFDWSSLPVLDKPIVLAGGLTPDNVAQAIRQVRPYAVDVSGGVELDKGIKDHKKITDFIRQVRAADNEEDK
jgi:phosphoribosylanthranilate isomerase